MIWLIPIIDQYQSHFEDHIVALFTCDYILDLLLYWFKDSGVEISDREYNEKSKC